MMKPDAVKQLDEAVAVMLADLNSATILRCARQARQVSILLAMADSESRRLVEGLTGDLSRLYRSVLVLERDPEPDGILLRPPATVLAHRAVLAAPAWWDHARRRGSSSRMKPALVWRNVCFLHARVQNCSASSGPTMPV